MVVVGFMLRNIHFIKGKHEAQLYFIGSMCIFQGQI